MIDGNDTPKLGTVNNAALRPPSNASDGHMHHADPMENGIGINSYADPLTDSDGTPRKVSLTRARV